jgi:hypothetical protein
MERRGEKDHGGLFLGRELYKYSHPQRGRFYLYKKCER